MKFLLRRLRDFLVSLLFGVLAGWLFLSIDAFLCGEANGQNAAGGGAAIGMLALAIAGGALVLAFTLLSCIGLACHFGMIRRDQRWQFEVGVIAGLLVVGGGITAWLEHGMCQAAQIEQGKPGTDHEYGRTVENTTRANSKLAQGMIHVQPPLKPSTEFGTLPVMEGAFTSMAEMGHMAAAPRGRRRRA